MTKELLKVEYPGWTGGRNTSVSPDQLDRTELVDTTNVRIGNGIGTKFGALTKRCGSSRVVNAALPGAVTGVYQWDDNGTKQVVAIAAGHLYYKSGTSWVDVNPAPDDFSTTVTQSFATFRAASDSAPLQLFIADGHVYKFDGTTLTQIDGTNSVPAADLLQPYHTRMFYRKTSLKKHAYWSVVGNAEDCTVNTATDGGSAMVDVLTGEDIKAFDVVGSSLLVMTDDSIVRFTGYSSDDIQIAQDTEGVAPDLGIVGRNAHCRADSLVAILTDRGPYLVTEGGATPIGAKVELDFESLDWSLMSAACIGYQRGRRELWYAVDDTVYVYSLRTQLWYGPFVYPFGITCMARYEDGNGQETLIAGCDDGYVRFLDEPGTFTDDTIYAGTQIAYEPFTGAGPTDINSFTPATGGFGAWSRGNADANRWIVSSNKLVAVGNIFGGSGYAHSATQHTNGNDNVALDCDVIVPATNLSTLSVCLRANNQDGASGTREFIEVRLTRTASANTVDIAAIPTVGGVAGASQSIATGITIANLTTTGTGLRVTLSGSVLTVYTTPVGGGAETLRGSVTLATPLNDASHKAAGFIATFANSSDTASFNDPILETLTASGTTYSVRIELPPEDAGVSEFRKTLDSITGRVNLRTGDVLTLRSTFDARATTLGTKEKTLSGSAAATADIATFTKGVGTQGKRHVLVIEDETPSTYDFTLHGLTLFFYNMLRR